MKNYRIEAVDKTLKGIITVGARVGYEGSNTYELEDLISALKNANSKIQEQGYKSVPCIITEGVLVGRAGDDDYEEKIYKMDFSWSPRLEKIEPDDFYKTLLCYADMLGQEMKQERVYLEAKGNTVVIKKN